MIVEDQQFLARPAAQNLLHDRLRQQHRAFNAGGLEFLAAADVHQADGSGLAQGGQLSGGNLQFLVLLVAAADMRDDFGHVQVVARAQAGQGFPRLKRATGAAADVIAAEQSPLRAGKHFQHARHGGLRIHGIAHGPKNF